MSIAKIKRNIIAEYKIKPTICFYYYLYNVVDYCGEEVVRKSFESISKQGDEVILGCYLPTDDTEKIGKEYGFKIVKVDEDDRNNFPESKIRNKVIINTNCNFVVPININVVYSKNIAGVIRRWLNNNYIRNKTLKISYKFQDVDGNIGRRRYGFSTVFYRPFLLRARGYDERTSYAAGSQKYGVRLFKDVYRIKTQSYNSNMVHGYHNNLKLPMLRKFFPNSTIHKLKSRRGRVVNNLINELLIDFNEGVKRVNNSYW